MSTTTYDHLLLSAKCLTTAFSSASSSSPLPFFSPTSTCHEHGTPSSFLPFFGIDLPPKQYFSLLSSRVKFEGMHFPEESFAVDERRGVVWCRGIARFTWIDERVEGSGNGEVERSWDETFVYRLEYGEREAMIDVQGGQKKKLRLLERYEVWADSGAMERAAGVTVRTK